MRSLSFGRALALALICSGLGAAIFTTAFASVLSRLPPTLPLTPYPAGTITYTVSSGEIAARIVATGQSPQVLNIDSANVSIDDLTASHFRPALLSSEDHTFEDHGGVSLTQTAWALLEARGGSTITQQLSRACVMRDQSKTASRKIRELLTALALEARFSKSAILETYSNCIYFGSDGGGTQLYGVAAAARRLLGVDDIRNLSIEQSATLAALLNSPSSHLASVRSGSTDQLKRRRDRVMRLMRRNFPDRYTDETIATEIVKPLLLPGVVAGSFGAARVSPRELIDLQWRLDGRPAKGTWRVRLTADLRLQAAAQSALNDGLQELERRHGLRNATLQGVLVAMRPDGRLLAVVGGRGETAGTFNRAAQARRSPGSLVKAFVDLAAVANGSLHDTPITAATVIGPAMLPARLRPAHCGPASRLRIGLARSDNCIAVVVGRAVGMSESAAVLKRAFGREPEHTIPMLLGGARGSEVTPLEVASAFSTFANNGLRAIPTLTEAVEAGTEERSEPRFLRVAGEAETHVVREMLRSVTGDAEPVAGATAGAAKVIAHLDSGFQLAGKTGTGSLSDLWFASVSPKIVIITWVGTDDNKPLPMSEGWAGATAALPIWGDFVTRALAIDADLFAGRFPQANGVTTIAIDPQRGCRTAVGVAELFVEGRLPSSCNSR